MPSSWNVYYVIFLSAVLALCVPALLSAVSYLVTPRRGGAGEPTAPARPGGLRLGEAGALGKRMNTRFFLGVNAALVLIALVLILIPCAGMLQPSAGAIASARGLVAIVSVASFAALGLFYSVRKGDLRWLETYRDPSEPKS